MSIKKGIGSIVGPVVIGTALLSVGCQTTKTDVSQDVYETVEPNDKPSTDNIGGTVSMSSPLETGIDIIYSSKEDFIQNVVLITESTPTFDSCAERGITQKACQKLIDCGAEFSENEASRTTAFYGESGACMFYKGGYDPGPGVWTVRNGPGSTQIVPYFYDATDPDNK